jgi:hypothetical protein
MLVPFAIEAEAIAGEAHWTPRELRGHHDALLRAWKRIGLFVFDGEHLSNSRLRQAIDDIGEGSVLRGRWNDFVQRVPVVAGGQLWRGDLDATTLDGLSKVAKICFARNAQVEALEAEAKALKLELITLASTGACNGFTAGEQAAALHIRQGDGAREVWEQRFAPLAGASSDRLKRVSIVDPYAVTRHVIERKEELTRFLTYLSASSVKAKHVSVYALSPFRDNRPIPPGEIIADLQRLRDNNALPRIASLTVYLAGGQRINRDRFVMFGDHYVWDLGHGLEPFEADFVTRDCAVSLKTWDAAKSYADIIDSMTADVRAIHIWGP